MSTLLPLEAIRAMSRKLLWPNKCLFLMAMNANVKLRQCSSPQTVSCAHKSASAY